MKKSISLIFVALLLTNLASCNKSEQASTPDAAPIVETAQEVVAPTEVAPEMNEESMNHGDHDHSENEETAESEETQEN